MRIRIALLICLFTGAWGVSQGQRYALYNSATLAESADNPWVSIFGESCKLVASNFFIPSVNSDGFLQGDAAESGRESLFWRRGLEDSLAGWQRKNHLQAYGQVNLLTVKYLLDEDTKTELLFDHSLRSAGGATVKNLSVNLAQGGDFITQSYYGPDAGLANFNLFHVLFTETSLGVRRSFDETFSAGVKLSFLGGIAHYEMGSGYSEGQYDVADDELILRMRGHAEFTPYADSVAAGHFLPSFRNPGFSISGGIEKWMSENFKFTLAIKDLGFIRWKEKGEEIVLDPDSTEIVIENFSVLGRAGAEAELEAIRARYSVPVSYTAALPVRVEAGASLLAHPNYTANFVGAYLTKFKRADFNLINDFHYRHFHLLLNAGYNTRNNTLLGLHFLLRSPTVDFFIGSENLLPSSRLYKHSQKDDFHYDSRTAANFNFGFALRLGFCQGEFMNSKWLHLRDKRGKRRKEECFVF